ncbi:hypothetical protein BDV06DRAFT_224344 [Aspergillus oleicola]
MSQAIYDNAAFLTSYTNLPRSQHGLPAVTEWPALRNMTLGGSENIDSSHGIKFPQADLDIINILKETYDIVYSSLTLHYIWDLPRLINAIYTSLKPNSRIIFNIKHSIYTAQLEGKWLSSGSGSQSWNGYGTGGERVRSWLGTDVRNCHRTTQTYLSTSLGVGVTLADFVE